MQAGVDEPAQENLVRTISKASELRTTEDIFHETYTYLKLIDRTWAARYSLKQALYALTHPQSFTQFIGKVYAQKDYTVRQEHRLTGACASHTIPLIIEKDDIRTIVVCTLEEPGNKTGISQVLQVKALYDDLHSYTTDMPYMAVDKALLVAHASFSSDAIEYAHCAGIELLSWDHPEQSLAQIIHSQGLYPITCLTGLTKTQKILLVQKNILLCQELLTYKQVLKKIQVPGMLRKYVYEECAALSTPRET